MQNPNQQHQHQHQHWQSNNQADIIADEADDDNDVHDMSGGAQGGAAGGSGQDFDKAYKNLVQQMLYQGQATGGNVLVPTDDYTLALGEDRKVDLTRIQEDLERRRAR